MDFSRSFSEGIDSGTKNIPLDFVAGLVAVGGAVPVWILIQELFVVSSTAVC